jgi:hypothetical protein
MKDKKDKIVIISIILSVFLFLFISGTINSGYHFVDDHEVIKIKSDLKTSSFIAVTRNWVKADLNINSRFRPLYYIHRVIETRLLGSDFFLWSLYSGILCCLALIFFYLGIRKLNYGLVESITFLIIIFIGHQSSVWWRLGYGESLGMVFLGLSFYYMSKSLNKRNYKVYNLLFIFFLILSSLTKESFLIIIPAFIIFKIWNEKTCIWSSLKVSILKNLILLVPLVIFIFELFFIKYHVGTTYSGLNTKISNNITSLLFNSLRFVKTYLNLLVVGLIILIVCGYIKKLPIRFNLLALVFSILIIVPNLFLYSKSGLVERYLLPSTFGLGILVMTIIGGIEKDPPWFKKMTLIFILISFLPFIANSYSDAKEFSEEGRSTNKLLSAISTNFVSGAPVMVIVDPVELYEKSVSLKTYLFYEENIDLFGYAFVKDQSDAEYQRYMDGWKSYFIGRRFENLTSAPGLLIFLDKKMIEEFFVRSKLPESKYLQVEIGNSPYALFKENSY